MLRELPAQHAGGAAATTRRSITGSYLVALLITGSLALGSGLFLTEQIGRHAEDAAVIDRAGAQRMLTQRIAALSAMAGEPGSDVLMREAIRRMADSHAALTTGETAPARRTEALVTHYFGGERPLDAIVPFFLAAAGAVAEAMPHDTGATLRQVALGPMLDQLQRAVVLHGAAARASSEAAIRADWITTGLLLLLLVMEGLFLFRPLARRVSRLTDQLEFDANRDALTGLLNRRAMAARLAQAIGAGLPAAVLAVDLDWFKEVNDAEGHAGGDALLCATATRLLELVRTEDAVGRMGGDEFVVCLIGVGDRRGADTIAERIRSALHRPVLHEGRLLRLGATIGVAVAPEDAATPDVLLRAADEALTRAKRDGRGGIGRATPEDATRLAREAVILRTLDRHDVLPDLAPDEAPHASPPIVAGGQTDGAPVGPALAGLCAHLQPIVGLSGNGTPPVRGFEALARWTHPELGPLSPTEFLPLAQRTGRLAEVTRQVRLDALRSFAALRAAGLPAPLISINLSAAEITRGDVADLLTADLEAIGVPLDRVEIEITEEVLLDRVSDRTLEQLVMLREDGARLALDDFGTGTSSLGQMLRLPIDTVKLDRSFVRELGQSRRAEEIVGAAISMARGLGMEVVAEGVESAVQASLLRRLGCHNAQGFLYARPMAAGPLFTWLRERAPIAVR